MRKKSSLSMLTPAGVTFTVFDVSVQGVSMLTIAKSPAEADGEEFCRYLVINQTIGFS